MTSTRPLKRGIAALGIVSLAALAVGDTSPANAQGNRTVRRPAKTHVESAPLLAIVGLREQRVSIYDATGKILESPVSSGASGLETPAGIYSVVQKEVDHTSNVYDDAEMPFMERITWTGIALHAGALPGFPASHGCVRMPLEFAERLYQITKLGMRVIVAREDISPAEIAQPRLFSASSARKAQAHGTPRLAQSAEARPSTIEVANTADDSEMPADLASRMEQLRSIASAKAFEAETADRQEKNLRLVAAKKASDAAAAVRTLRGAEANLAKTEADFKAAERALETAKSAAQGEQAEIAKERSLARIEAAKAQLEAARPGVQAAADAAQRAEEEAQDAAAAKTNSAEAAEEAKQNLSPVSVFISRKTQRLYIRKSNQPVFEGPVMIRDASKPIGSFVYTALNYTGTAGNMRWNVVSMYKNAINIEPFAQDSRARGKSSRPAESAQSDVAAAQAALDRLTVPQDAVDRIAEVVLPGSSLIISDEGPSIETGKDTDFVVLMSGEPQGGIAIRQSPPKEQSTRFNDDDDDRPRRSSRGRRSSGGGFGFFSD